MNRPRTTFGTRSDGETGVIATRIRGPSFGSAGVRMNSRSPSPLRPYTDDTRLPAKTDADLDGSYCSP